MKKNYLIGLLAFAASICTSQNISFPDPNFKASVLASNSGIDVNADGEISFAEALSVTDIDIIASQNVTSIVGVQHFTNLQNFTVYGIAPIALDLSGLPNLRDVKLFPVPVTQLTLTGATSLKTLDIAGTSITSLDLSGLQSLENVSLNCEELASIQLSGCTALKTLEVFTCPISSLGLSGLTSLETVLLNFSGVTEIHASGLPQLEMFTSNNCPNLVSVDVSNCAQLNTVTLEANESLTAVDVEGCTSLLYFQAIFCAIPSIEFSGLPNVKQINMSDGTLSHIGVANCPNLELLALSGNQLSALDLSGCTGLKTVGLNNNNLTTVDFSDCHQLVQASCGINPWETIFIKNGSNEQAFDAYSSVDEIIYICADDSQLTQLQNMLTNPNYVVNSYCSYTPGGNYNTIQGHARFDAGANGCDASDPVFPMLKIGVVQGGNSGYVQSNAEGFYKAYTNTGSHTLAPWFENPSYFIANPASDTVNFPSMNSSVETRDFCISPNGTHPDAEVALVYGSAEPGFDASYVLVLRNKGNQVLSGNLVFTFDDSRADFLAAYPEQTSVNAGMVDFAYANLLPFETRQYFIELNVNSPMETPAVNIGDTLPVAVSAVVSNDESPEDNVFSAIQAVVGSFDPNDKTCLEGEIASADKIGEYLHYLIRFENTGNAPAHNIVVKDVLDATKFDVSSLVMLSASHASEMRVNANKTEFIFEGIELAPQATGYVLFKVKTLASLTVGSTVSNKADIFFDYNFPIETNNAETIFQNLSVGEHADASITFYPNPATDRVTIKANGELKRVELFDSGGRLLEMHTVNSTEANIGMNGKSSGIYIVKAISETGTKVGKIVKQ